MRIVLLKDCPLGRSGLKMRISESQALNACNKGWARCAENWNVPPKRMVVDVKK